MPSHLGIAIDVPVDEIPAEKKPVDAPEVSVDPNLGVADDYPEPPAGTSGLPLSSLDVEDEENGGTPLTPPPVEAPIQSEPPEEEEPVMGDDKSAWPEIPAEEGADYATRAYAKGTPKEIIAEDEEKGEMGVALDPAEELRRENLKKEWGKTKAEKSEDPLKDYSYMSLTMYNLFGGLSNAKDPKEVGMPKDLGVVSGYWFAINKVTGGVPDVAVSGATNLFGAGFSLVPGSYNAIFENGFWGDKYKESFRKYTKMMTFQPRTEEGKTLEHGIGKFILKYYFDPAYKYIADPLKAAGHTNSTAVAEGVITGLLYVLPFWRPKAKPKAKPGEYIPADKKVGPPAAGPRREGSTFDNVTQEAAGQKPNALGYQRKVDSPLKEGEVLPPEAGARDVPRIKDSIDSTATRDRAIEGTKKLESPDYKILPHNQKYIEQAKKGEEGMYDGASVDSYSGMKSGELQKYVDANQVLPHQISPTQMAKASERYTPAEQILVRDSHQLLIKSAYESGAYVEPKILKEAGMEKEAAATSSKYNWNKQSGAVDFGAVYDAAVNAGNAIHKKSIAFWDVAGIPFGASAKRVVRLGTPTAARVGNMLMNELPAAISLSTGRFLSQFNEIIQPLRGRIGWNKKLNDQVWLKLTTPSTRTTPAVARIASDITLLMRQMETYFFEKGLDMTPVAGNYFPQVYDLVAMGKNKDGFLGELRTREMDNSVYDTILQTEGVPRAAREVGGHGGQGGMRFTVSHADMSRKINWENIGGMKEFLVTDIPSVITNYIQGMVKKAEFTSAFGRNEQKLDGMINGIMSELGEMGATKSRTDVTGRIYSNVNSWYGIHGRIESPKLKAINTATASAFTAAFMPLSVLWSMMEFATPITKYGIQPKAYWEGAKYAATESGRSIERLFTGKNKIPRTEMSKFVEYLGLLDISSLDMASLDRYAGRTQKWTRKWMRLFMQTQITNMQTVIASASHISYVKSRARYLANRWDGRKAENAKRELAAEGLNPYEAAQWYSDGMTDQAFNLKVNSSTVLGVTDVVTKPNPSKMPSWMNRVDTKLFTLFTRFYTTFGNIFVSRVLKDTFGKSSFDKKGKVIMGLVAMAAITYFIGDMRAYIKYGDKGLRDRRRRAPLRKAVDTVDEMGMFGIATRPKQVLLPSRYGKNDKTIVRVAGLLGIAVGTVANAIDSVTSNRPGWRTSKTLAKLLPGFNLTHASRKATQRAIYNVLR